MEPTLLNKQIRNYTNLMRLKSPTGIFLLLWPAWWSLAFAMGDKIQYGMFFLLALGAVVMRSAGCIINDIVDRKLDAGVERTKKRPLASGDIALYQAVLVVILLLIIGGLILFSLPQTAIILGVIILIPIFIYPFMKRVTYWPQIFLALTFNWGALMGWAAIHDEISFTAIAIYIASMFWTLSYDTIYAHQDKKDDVLMGVKSSALRLGKYTKKYLAMFLASMIGILWVLGLAEKVSFSYHLVMLVAALQAFWQVYTVDLDKTSSCMSRFKSNAFLGAIIFAAIIIGLI